MSLIDDSPFAKNPIAPVQYGPEAELNFRCHKGISCWNACCKQIDIALTPYDIIRLKNRLGLSSEEFLKKHTVPFEMDRDGMPGVKMRTQDDVPVCLFMDEETGCTVYEDRPTACRYYPVGLLSQRKQSDSFDTAAYVIVVEDHCLGHKEDNKMTIQQYREEQGVEEYDELARGWRQLVLKKMSAGSAIGKPSPTSLSLFFMVCYNHDKFREFINSPSFQKSFDLDEETQSKINTDDVELMLFGFRFLKQVMFGEESIPLKEGAAEERIKERKEVHEMRRKAEIEHHKMKEDEKYKDA